MSHQEQIREAFASRTPLTIRGGGSKGFLDASPSQQQVLHTRDMNGILDYQPEELFIRARAGTPLQDIENLLRQEQQILPFEPPHFSPAATLGGAIASGLSGPSRPWRGAARDFVLGCILINGRGERLRFGGEVIKNVAGYDVSRLQCGAHGTLGLLEELSIKTLPAPEHELTLELEMDEASALQNLMIWNRQPLPLSGAAWHRGMLRIRLSGSTAAVNEGRRRIGGEASRNSGFWERLKEQRLEFFDTDKPLWRISLPRGCGILELPGELLLDWGGAQRWLLSNHTAETLSEIARSAGGHLRPYHQRQPVPLSPGLMLLHQRLKAAFDPAGILNPDQFFPQAR
jgi:glycolate oxidase FAD binding subunit